MVNRTIIIGLLLFLAPFLALSGSGPKINFATVEHDFGDVKYGESPSVELTFTNIGDDDLIIKGIESSCGCAKAIRGSDRIAPGRTGKIHAQVETTGLRPGRSSKAIWVDSNDPRHPRTTLRLRYNVVRHVRFEPETLVASVSGGDKDAVFRLAATNYGSDPVTLKSRSSAGSSEVVLIPEVVVAPPGGKVDFQLSVAVKREPARPFINGTALLETSDPLEKILEVRYLIRLLPTGARNADKRS